MNARTETRVRTHGETLIRHYAPNETDPVALCKRLRRLEGCLHRTAEDYCNGTCDAEGWEWAENTARRRLHELLPELPDADIVINADPRGYALKVRPEAAPSDLFRDWGGYGLLVPDLTE